MNGFKSVDREPAAYPAVQAYAASLFAVGAGFALAIIARPLVGPGNVGLIFLTVVIAVAVRYGIGPSLAAATASALAYDFFFIAPVFTFAIADARDLGALILFFALAALAAVLASRVRAEAEAARDRAGVAEALHGFALRMAGAADADDLATITADSVAAMLRRDALLLLPDRTGTFQLRARSPSSAAALHGLELDAARAVWEGGKGRDREVLRLGPWLFYPLRAGANVAGLIAVSLDPGRKGRGGEGSRLFAALAEQAAGALERIRLARERDEARITAQEERSRNAILSSLSHDLRTPLAVIAGAATALRDDGRLYDEAARAELVLALATEAERLSRFVDNLLDMSRLEAGALSLAREAVDVGEIVDTALRRTAGVLAGRPVRLDIEPGTPMLRLNAVLFEQVLVNLLDNAAKYAPEGSAVTVASRPTNEGVEIAVADEGPGLPKADIDRVFDKFHRADAGPVPGAGLGLAICRGFVEAMGGAIRAENRADRSGAVFRIAFPRDVFASLGEPMA